MIRRLPIVIFLVVLLGFACSKNKPNLSDHPSQTATTANTIETTSSPATEVGSTETANTKSLCGTGRACPTYFQCKNERCIWGPIGNNKKYDALEYKDKPFHFWVEHGKWSARFQARETTFAGYQRCAEPEVCTPDEERGGHKACQQRAACKDLGFCSYIVVLRDAQEKVPPVDELFFDLRVEESDTGQYLIAQDRTDEITPVNAADINLNALAWSWGESLFKDRGMQGYLGPLSTISGCENVDRDKDFGLCLPGSKEHCANSTACRRFGKCTYIPHRCTFGAKESNECDAPRGSEGVNPCRDFGKCTAFSGECRASNDADCQKGSICSQFGLCGAEGGDCMATKVGFCENTKGCAEEARCCPSRRWGSFAWFPICKICPYQEDACKNSLACSREGRCTERNGKCVPTILRRLICQHARCAAWEWILAQPREKEYYSIHLTVSHLRYSGAASCSGMEDKTKTVVLATGCQHPYRGDPDYAGMKEYLEKARCKQSPGGLLKIEEVLTQKNELTETRDCYPVWWDSE